MSARKLNKEAVRNGETGIISGEFSKMSNLKIVHNEYTPRSKANEANDSFDEGAHVTPELVDLSKEIVSYMTNYLSHEQNMLFDLRNAMEDYRQTIVSIDFSAFRQALEEVKTMLEDGSLSKTNIIDALTKEAGVNKDIAQTLSSATESVMGAQSDAQAISAMAIMKSLELWAREQEIAMEKLKPKRIDWYEEPARKRNNPQDLDFLRPPPRAA